MLAALPPHARMLKGEDEKRVAELETRIAELTEKDQLDEAIILADEVAETRTRVQGIDHWQAADARQAATTGRLLRGMTSAQRRQWQEASDANQLANSLFAAGQFEEPERLLRHSWRAFEQLVPGDHPHIATTLNNLAYILHRRGSIEEAEQLFEKSLEMRRRHRSGDHPQLVLSLANLSSLYRDRGALEQAEVLARDALAMSERLYSGDHSFVAGSMQELGLLLTKRGLTADAEELFIRTLEMNTRLHRGDHPDVAGSLNNLGHIRATQGRFADAEIVYRRALEMNMRLFEADHPSVANSQNNLASVLADQGRFDDAESAYRGALAMYYRIHPYGHDDVARALGNLAGVRRSLGDIDDAESLLRESLAMRRRLAGDPSKLALSLNNLAVVLMDRGAHNEAEALLEESLEIRVRIFGGDHGDVVEGLSNLAYCKEAQGARVEAEEIYEQALTVTHRALADAHPLKVTVKSNFAMFCLASGDLRRAESLARDVLAMRQELYPNDHPEVALSISNLGGVLWARGAMEDAELRFRDALDMGERLFYGDHPLVATALSNLGSIRATRGALDQAEEHLRSSFAMSERMRTKVVGDEHSRADFGERLGLRDRALGWASVLIRLRRGPEALAVLERGRGRAALDLLERAGRDLFAEAKSLGDAERTKRLEEAQTREDTARTELASAEALLAGRTRERSACEQRGDVDADAKAKKLAEYDQQIAQLTDDVKQKRIALTQAGSAVLVELRGLFPAAQALTLEQILAGLAPDEGVVSFAFGGDGALVAVAAGGASHAAIIADGKEAKRELVDKLTRLRDALAERPARAAVIEPATLQSIRATLLPESILSALSAARRWVVLPDGPLNGIPFEVLWGSDGATEPRSNEGGQGLEIVYGPSATVYLDRRGKARSRDGEHRPPAGVNGHLALVLGDPDFGAGRPREPEYPQQGVLLAQVVEGGNAAAAGLRRGDVLLSYGSEALASADQLGPVMQKVQAAATQPSAIARGANSGEAPPAALPTERGFAPPSTGPAPDQERNPDSATPNPKSRIQSRKSEIVVAYWRDGMKHETRVPPGKLGVYSSPARPDEGLRSMKVMDQITRGGDAFAAQCSAVEQIRLFGGQLPGLPGSGREARAIAEVVRQKGGAATLLLGADAKAPALWVAVTSQHPRYIHLATHGLMGTADRPFDAGLALAQPKEPTAEDVGFLRLEDLITRWGGRLKDCDLVVLSACDTQRGIQKGDSMMSLPLGFFFAGAPTVIASLWKVDDTATQLLMTRFYENLLGSQESRDSADPKEPRAPALDHPDSGQGSARADSPGERRADVPRRAMTKIEALNEAKVWLRGLTRDEADKLLGPSAEGRWQPLADSGRGFDAAQKVPIQRGPTPAAPSDRPFEHPYYWAAFILIGAPE